MAHLAFCKGVNGFGSNPPFAVILSLQNFGIFPSEIRVEILKYFTINLVTFVNNDKK